MRTGPVVLLQRAVKLDLVLVALEKKVLEMPLDLDQGLAVDLFAVDGQLVQEDLVFFSTVWSWDRGDELDHEDRGLVPASQQVRCDPWQ